MQDHIKAKEAELRATSVSAWAFSAAAIFFLGCGLAALVLFGWQGWLNWTTLFVAFTMGLFFGYLALVSWAVAQLNAKSLASLKQEASKELAERQAGVWPPPPTGPKG